MKQKYYNIENLLSKKADYNLLLELYFDDMDIAKITNGEFESVKCCKQYINAMYGMMVTKTITDTVEFDNGEWVKTPLTNATFIDKISREKKKLSKVFSAFQFGAWVTAYARRNLWRGILAIDPYVIYCDTDSIKCVHTDTDFFDNYNKEIAEREKKRAVMLGVDETLFAPKDKFNITHRLGIFDYEGNYDKFKTLGAKKYIYN